MDRVAGLSHNDAMAFGLAAVGDTWGISGPVFLLLFFLAAAVLTVATVLHRRFLFGGAPDFQGVERLHPQQVAYLNSASRAYRTQLTVDTALGGLRAAGILGMKDGSLVTSGPLPPGATPLDQAVYHAAGQRVRPRDLRTHPWVVAAIDQLRQGLEAAGLLETARQRRSARLIPLLLLGLLGLGVVRLVAGLTDGKPVLLLVLMLAAFSVVTLVLLLALPLRTRAANSALSQLRVHHAHLSPKSSPAYATYGAAGAAMGVALFGGVALWGLDPGFAAEAQVERHSIASSGDRNGGSGGGDGGGDGGGGCGGGGCGGCGGCGG